MIQLEVTSWPRRQASPRYCVYSHDLPGVRLLDLIYITDAGEPMRPTAHLFLDSLDSIGWIRV